MTRSERLNRVLAAVLPEDRGWLAAQLDRPAEAQARRKDGRDELIREALARIGAPNPTAAASHLSRLLINYLASAWRADRVTPPTYTDPMKHLLHGIAEANRGKGLAWRQLERIGRGQRTPDLVINSAGNDKAAAA